MLNINTSTLLTLKIDLSYHPFIKYDIFEVDVHFPPRVTPIGIVTQYYEYHNMSYIYQSKNDSPCNHVFPDIQRNYVWILRTGRKEPTTPQKVLESISSHQLTGKCNMVHVITYHRDKDMIRTNLQENICILNQIRPIQVIGNKMISLTTKTSTPYNIGDVVKSPLRYEWYDSMFPNY